MMNVSQDMAEALDLGTRGILEPVVTWLGYDLSDRVESVGTYTRSVSPLLGEQTISNLQIRLSNSDKYFSPIASSEDSIIANTPTGERNLSRVTVQLRIRGTDETIDFYHGVLTRPNWAGESFVMTVRDVLHHANDQSITRLAGVGRQTAGDEIKSLLTGSTLIVAGDFDSVSFDYADEVHNDMNWSLFGSIQDTTVGRATGDLARSGLGVLLSDEDGTIRYLLEFPSKAWNDGSSYPPLLYPVELNKTNATDFVYSEDYEAYATEIAVQYLGGTWYRANAAAEANTGKVTRPYRAPYIALGRQADVAAYVLSEAFSSFTKVLTFATGLGHFPMQLYDRCYVEDPMNGTSNLYRVIKKGVNFTQARIDWTVIREGHWTSILDATFGRWDSMSYASGTLF